jgi:hypothetical protein
MGAIMTLGTDSRFEIDVRATFGWLFALASISATPRAGIDDGPGRVDPGDIPEAMKRSGADDPGNA